MVGFIIRFLLISVIVEASASGNMERQDKTGDKIVMAVLLPWSGNRPLGKTIAGAVTLAIEKLNADETLLPNRTVEFVWNDTQCNVKYGLKEAVDFWRYQDPLHVIIGGACSIVCEPVGLLAAVWEIPMVSWGCSSHILSDKKEYPTFARTVGPYTKVGFLFLMFSSVQL